MFTLTHRLDRHAIAPQSCLHLPLNAEERTRSRHRFETVDGEVFIMRLPRGTILQDGDFLQAETGEIVRIIAKPEPVLTVRANMSVTLLKSPCCFGGSGNLFAPFSRSRSAIAFRTTRSGFNN